MKTITQNYEIDEVSCVTNNKITEWWFIFYYNTIKPDIPDESRIFIYPQEGHTKTRATTYLMSMSQVSPQFIHKVSQKQLYSDDFQ